MEWNYDMHIHLKLHVGTVNTDTILIMTYYYHHKKQTTSGIQYSTVYYITG